MGAPCGLAPIQSQKGQAIGGTYFTGTSRDSLNPFRPNQALRTVEAPDLRTEARLTLKIGVPLALGELGWMSTYIVDALMVGRLHNSALPIAASSLGNTIFYAIAFLAIYLLNGLETLIAQAFGRGERDECVHLLAQSFWIMALGIPFVMLATLGSLHLLPLFGTPPEIAAETSRYVHALVWSTAPLMGYMALRRFLQSINRVAVVSASLITASLVNLLFDWMFLFGHLGAPAMGIAGSGWATGVVRVYMLALLVGGTWWAFRRDGYRLERRLFVPEAGRLRALLGIGWPSGIDFCEQLSMSTYLSILCSRLGTVLLAANQVVLDLNAFVYQVPSGMSYATLIRVGQNAGRNNLPGVRRAANTSVLLCGVFMLFAAAAFALFSRFWAGLYTNSAQVVAAAAPIFTVCAVLLICDTFGVLMASALTGLGDTRTPMIVNLFWNWAIGMPLAYLLAFHYGLALHGLWLGRAAGAVGGGTTMLYFWRLKLRRASEGGRRSSLSLVDGFHAEKRIA